MVDYFGNYIVYLINPSGLFSMEEYKISFDLDTKIAWNRQRLREIYTQYKALDKYYPLFFAYMGFLGVYTFEFLIYSVTHDLALKNSIFIFICSILFGGIVWSFVLIIKIVLLKEWKHESIPQEIYSEGYEKQVNLLKGKSDVTPDNNKVEESLKKGILTMLEDSLRDNNEVMKRKKQSIGLLIKIIIFNLILYTLNILYYKFLTNV